MAICSRQLHDEAIVTLVRNQTSGDRITDASLVSAGELLDGAEVYKKTI